MTHNPSLQHLPYPEAFEVFDYEPFAGRRVILRTDDWIEAEEASSVKHWRNRQSPIRIKGIHPTHTIGNVTRTFDIGDPYVFVGCTTCEAPDNGCFAIHAPCGYEFTDSMSGIIEKWKADRG